MKVTKNQQKLIIIIDFLIPQSISKSHFSLDSKIRNLFGFCGPNTSFVCYMLYKLWSKTCWPGAQKWYILGLSWYINSYNSKSIYCSCLNFQTYINYISIEGLYQIAQPTNYKMWSESCCNQYIWYKATM